MTTVIGSGLLAKSFAATALGPGCLVLASGVSNSGERRDAEFRREAQTVEAAMRAHPSARVVYFSTCSILQKEQTPYIRHKMEMEARVADAASSFHIFRLPQVVGLTRNLTLVSYFVDSVLQRRRVAVQRHAERNLVDIADVVRLIQHLVEREIGVNSMQYLAAADNVPVLDVLETIGRILAIEPVFDVVDAGEAYAIPSAFMRRHFGADDPLMQADYWRTVLRKHVPAMAANSCTA